MLVSGASRLPRAQYIMVVDDDSDIRESIGELLRYEGYRVELAVDGRDALDRLFRESELPSLIILDLMMPRMNGWELTELLKSYSRTANIPLIVVSAAAEPPPAGTTVLKKPLSGDDLLNHLDRVLRSQMLAE